MNFRSLLGVIALSVPVTVLAAGLPKASIQALIRALQDSNLEVRIAAAQALAQVPEESAAKPLETALIASADPAEQDALSKALVAADDSSSVKRLSDALNNPQFTWGAGAKAKVVAVVGVMGQKKVLKWLTDLSVGEQDPAVKAAAIRALGQIGAPPKKEEKK